MEKEWVNEWIATIFIFSIVLIGIVVSFILEHFKKEIERIKKKLKKISV